jgi:hypothetical protein
MAEMDTFDKDALAAKFGIAASVINDDPTLQAALNEIITKRIIDKDLQLAILKKTDWFQKHTEDWRKWKFYKDTNPATYKADLQANAAKIAKSYFKAGIKIDADTAIKLAEQAMQKSATVNGQVVNYNEDYFAQVMANSIDFTKKKTVGGRVVYDFGGQLEKVAESLYKTAWDYGFPATVSNQAFSKWMETNMRGLVAGTINTDDVDNQLQSQAKSMFPGLTDQINRGLTLREAADPWLTAIANEWEEDPRFMDLNDNTLYMALNSQDEKGNIAPMNLYQAKVLARKNPKWQYTSKAKEEYTNIGQKILQDFGFLG